MQLLNYSFINNASGSMEEVICVNAEVRFAEKYVDRAGTPS
jgi:hypothetical protein